MLAFNQTRGKKHNTNIHVTLKGNWSKATGSLFPSKSFAKLEMTLSIVQQNKNQTQKAQKQCDNNTEFIDRSI